MEEEKSEAGRPEGVSLAVTLLYGMLGIGVLRWFLEGSVEQ